MIFRVLVVVLTVLAVLTQSVVVFGQTGSGRGGGKVYRVGWMTMWPTPPTALGPAFVAFKERFAERGYVEGKNIIFEPRWSDGDYERVPELLADLERSGVDVIFVPGTRAARLSQNYLKKTPLIVYSCDPFEHVARLSNRGGNVTGVTCMTSELTPKRLEILKEALPAASRIVYFSEPKDAPLGLKLAQEAAPRLGFKLSTVGITSRADVARALNAIAAERPDALFVYPDPLIGMERTRIAEFALKHRLPTMFAFRYYVDAGGLMSYGAYEPDLFRRAADQAVKILAGAAPGDLPMEQASRFELVINLKTARALGLTIPPSLLNRAEHVIE